MEQALAEADAEAGRHAEHARAHAARSGQLETALEQTRQACIERDRRMTYLEAELDLSRSEGASHLRALAALGVELEQLRLSSRGQATRIRLSALREAAEVSARIRALAGAPEAAAESMLAALERALDRLGTDWEGRDAHAGRPTAPAAEPQASASPAVEDAADPGPEIAVTATAGESELAELEAALDPTVGEDASEVPGPAVGTARRVTVDIGPFSDFSQLVSFEDAANAIAATNEISIRRFSEGRASIEVSLREPIDLLAELEASSTLSFTVRSSAEDELVLDLSK